MNLGAPIVGQQARLQQRAGCIFHVQTTPRVGSEMHLGAGGVPRFFPFGHPPFFALRRAALALASEVARPPRRPSACAALFISNADGPTVIIHAVPIGVASDVARDGGTHAPSAAGYCGVASRGRVLSCDSQRHRRARFIEEVGDGVHFVFWLLVGLISFGKRDNSEPLGYCKGKVKFLLGGGGGSENLSAAPEKYNGKLSASAGRSDAEIGGKP